MRKKTSQEGQIVLVVLLVSMVAMTIGLSVVSRSVTDVRISAQSQEAARAFWIAQAGLEKALKVQSALSGTVGDINYQVTKTALGGSQTYLFCDRVNADEVFPVWLVGHTADGEINAGSFYQGNKLTLYWGNQGESGSSETTPAIAASLIYQDTTGNFRSRLFPFDSYGNRSVKTNFSSAEAGSFSLGGSIFAFKATIDNIKSLSGFSKPYLLSLKMFFSGSPQAFGIETESGANLLPEQGSFFDAQASVTSSLITRRLSECNPWSVLPGVFSYLVFSGGNLNK